MKPTFVEFRISNSALVDINVNHIVAVMWYDNNRVQVYCTSCNFTVEGLVIDVLKKIEKASEGLKK